MTRKSIVVKATIKRASEAYNNVRVEVVTNNGAELAYTINRGLLLRQLDKDSLIKAHAKWPFDLDRVLSDMLLDKEIVITHTISNNELYGFTTKIQFNTNQIALLGDFSTMFNGARGFESYMDYIDVVQNDLELFDE
ncbi:hypothetical protein [Latilactobacillus sakei]|uniref:hypothetical protein n=1 Tax=Latilactobacillus sakei TaxID=1599 RepID=UPI003F52A3EF